MSKHNNKIKNERKLMKERQKIISNLNMQCAMHIIDMLEEQTRVDLEPCDDLDLTIFSLFIFQ